MHRKAFCFLELVLTLWSIPTARALAAETSQTIAFTGCDKSLADTVALRLRLFTASTGGAPVFEETQANIDGFSGCISVLIGDGTSGGIPAPIFTNQPSLWIAFALDSDPATELGGGRTPITAAGYTFKAVYADHASQAANAGQLGGIPPSGFIQTTGGSISGNSAGPALTVTNASPRMGAGLLVESRSLQGVAGVFTNTAGGDLLQGKDRSGATVFRLLNNGEAFLVALTTAGIINTGTQYNIGGNRVLSIAAANTFVGVGAGQNITTGDANNFFGVQAGTSNTTGRHNDFFGYLAGQNNTTGSGNNFFGSGAGTSNTTGYNNDFFGYNAGIQNTMGVHNAFFGHIAGYRNTTGSENAFFGTNTGGNNTAGSYNSFYGTDAGFGNGTGNYNAFFGHRAGMSNINENNNTFIGAWSNGAPGITNATALGTNAAVTQSNSVVLGNNANIGIGTSAPKAKLHVQDGNVLVGAPGAGIILKSPNGATCRLLMIDNAGAMVLAQIACP